MKIGIMQGYFFPYIGYFQLIKAVDTYVNLDHVSFMKRSYMTRNILKNNTNFNIPVFEGSQNKNCCEVFVDCNERYVSKLYKTLTLLYKKELQYDEVMDEILEPFTVFSQCNHPISISTFNYAFIHRICAYLEIPTRIIPSSMGLTYEKREKGLQDIVKHYEGTTYINAIGGQQLYNKENFAKQGIELKFIQMNKNIDFDNPYTSILDLLFRYSKEHIQEQLGKYELI